MTTGANETDVREEIATPLLAALGYARGTPNDIAREPSLTYEREFLGRKKRTDPPLRGRADYVLSVMGAGRWVLEIKAPHEPIDVGAIEQAISYGRHPEVSATYAVVLNGVRLTVHHVTQRSIDAPLVDLAVNDAASLAEQLEPLLSPAAVRRDCSPPKVDLAKPLAPGLRSRAGILRGEIKHDNCRWSANVQLPAPAASNFEEMCRRLRGFRTTVTGGLVGRDESSRIRARLTWAMPHDELLRFAMDKRLMEVDYVALSDHLSTDDESPTVFDVVGSVEIEQGEPVFDMMRWETQTAGLSTQMRYAGRATGYIADGVFQGSFNAQYYCGFPAAPLLKIELEIDGTFRIEIDGR